MGLVKRYAKAAILGFSIAGLSSSVIAGQEAKLSESDLHRVVSSVTKGNPPLGVARIILEAKDGGKAGLDGDYPDNPSVIRNGLPNSSP